MSHAHHEPPTVNDRLYESVYSGAIGGTTVALLFLALDTLSGRPLDTPSLLGGRVMGDVPQAGAGIDLTAVAIMTLIHFAVGDTVLDGIGSSPFSMVVSPNGRLAFVNNTGSHDISVMDVATRAVIAHLDVPAQPIVMAVHPSGESLWVSSEGEDRLTVFAIPGPWRSGSVDHDGLLPNPGAPGAEAWAGPQPEDRGPDVPDAEKTEVAFMGMIHGEHRTSAAWGLEQVRETLRRFRPDVVCAEIPPDRWARIWRDFTTRGVFEDPRIRVFPAGPGP